jgi:nucleoside-diphosphate-sugar epimerase
MADFCISKGRVLLTGGNGYIGSNLVRRLLIEGFEVHVIVRPKSNLTLLKAELCSITVHRYDEAGNTLVEVMEKVKPEIVFHLGSLFLPDHSAGDVKALIDSNILFSTQLIDAMSVVGIGCLVNTGTSWQSFENEIYNPVNLYAATKQAFEDILRYYTEAKDLRVITLRLFDTYGANDPRPKLVNLLKQTFETGHVLEMSPGEQLIDLVYIEDVVECFIVAGRRLIQAKESLAEVYAVSSLAPISLRELVAVFSEVAGKPLNVNWGVKSYRSREVMLPWASGCTLPEWGPKTPLTKGLRRCLEGLESQNNNYG